jgi:hypothetical protein
MLAQSLQWLPPDRGNAGQLARAPSSISPNRSGRQSCPDTLVHREDDDPLGERHAQLTHVAGRRDPSHRMRSSSCSLSLSELSAGSWSTAQRNSRSTRAGKHPGLGRRAAYGVQPRGRGPRPGENRSPRDPGRTREALAHGDARVRAGSAATGRPPPYAALAKAALNNRDANPRQMPKRGPARRPRPC